MMVVSLATVFRGGDETPYLKPHLNGETVCAQTEGPSKQGERG